MSAGPLAATGWLKVTVALPLLLGSCVLVAVTVTVGGAGKGVVYRPAAVIVPGLIALPDGAAIDHVTPLLKLPVPATVAANCTCVPMMALFGVIAIEVIVGPEGGGVIAVPPPPPPQAEINRLIPIPEKTAKLSLMPLTSPQPRSISSPNLVIGDMQDAGPNLTQT